MGIEIYILRYTDTIYTYNRIVEKEQKERKQKWKKGKCLFASVFYGLL